MNAQITALISVAVIVSLASGCATRFPGPSSPPAYFQAHRGGLDEVPENTLVALEHAWDIPGAVPEIDVRTTKDGVMVCLHDDTLARTTNVPESLRETPLSELAFSQVRACDAGSWFDARFAGERVPTLEEVFEAMRGRPERQLYLDVKGADFQALKALIDTYGLVNQLIFVHGNQDTCHELQQLFNGARTMTWIGGDPEAIKQKYARVLETGFKGLSQLQFHLKVAGRTPRITYVLDDAFLAQAVADTRAAGVDLQLRPFEFDPDAMRHLLDLGVRWYAADAPAAFAACLREAAKE